jgi:hypothetical protein
MPGITANLSPQAFAIWETIEKKKRGADPRGAKPWNQGRSKWLSHVIIEHQAWASRHDAVLKEKFELEEKLRLMTAARDKLQEIVLEQDS